MIDTDNALYWTELAACNPAAPTAKVKTLEEADRIFHGKNPADGLAVCQTCPVLAFCRRYIDDIEETNRSLTTGVFGGQTPAQRSARRTAARKRSHVT